MSKHQHVSKCQTFQPENVMFTSAKSNDVKLIDFGLASKLDPKEMVKVTTGTAEFAAPEIVNSEPVGFYSDMWSIGVMSYVLLVTDICDISQSIIIIYIL